MSTARALQNDLHQGTGVNVSDQTIRNRLHEGGLRARCPLVGPVLTARTVVELNWHLPLNTRSGLSAIGTLRFSQMRAGSPWAHVTDVKGHGEAVENVMLPVTLFSMTGFGGGSMMVWGGISMEGSTDLYRLDNGTLTAIRYRDEIRGGLAIWTFWRSPERPSIQRPSAWLVHHQRKSVRLSDAECLFTLTPPTNVWLS